MLDHCHNSNRDSGVFTPLSPYFMTNFRCVRWCMPAIVFPDRNIALGSGYAITGETVSQYNERLANVAKYAQMDNVDPMKLTDEELLKTLPYTLMFEEIESGYDQTVSPHALFMANLKLSFGEEFYNNAAIQESLKIDGGYMEGLMQVHELSTTELGGNDAINCYWSFNENDDIIYPNYAIDPEHCTRGLGRVYAETYQKTQVVVWMTFGVPKYNNIWQFYTKAINPELAATMHSGVASAGFTLGRIFGGALVFTFRMATLPLYILTQIGHIFTTYRITKYFELRVTMPLWFRAVNDMSSTVAVNMGIQKNDLGKIDDQDSDTINYNPNNVPGMMKYGLDIYSIMTKRARYLAERDGRKAPVNGEDLLKIYEENEGDALKIAQSHPEVASSAGWFSKWYDAYMASGTGSNTFVGFKVEKSTDASESISNSTAQSELQEQLNQTAKSVASTKFRFMGGDTGTAAGDIVTGAMASLSDVFSGASNAMGVGGLAGLALGSGYISIPEVWQDSSFSTSYSFSAQCVAHYCDRVSIFQNYMPLFMLLAGALPRQAGENSYVQPFLVRAYCQGRFAVPVGIIDSVSVKRGADEYGWTEDGFPTRLDINWTIKDLTPLLFLALSGSGGSNNSKAMFEGVLDDLASVFASNTSMQEYLSTLGGLGLKERVLGFDMIKRKMKVWWNMHFETRLKNPYFWGTTVGAVPALQTVMSFWKPSISNN